jgi:cobalt-zinc-cadmium efflux system membrane fusion protein
MKYALYALCAVGCHRGETAVPHADIQPEDELWLSSDQMAKAGVRVEVALPQPVSNAIAATGRVAFDDLHVTHVYSPVTGHVTRVLARPGQRVAKGAPLLAIQSPDVGTAFADVVKAQADLQASEADFHREERLLGDDATSRRSYEGAQDAFRRASAEYQRAQQRASLLHAGAGDVVTQEYMLRSGLEGDVIVRNVTPGMEVAGQYSGGNSSELFTIGDIKQVWVLADVPDTALPNIHLGDAADVRVVAYPGRVFTGTIDLVASAVDPATRTGRVRLSLRNDTEELKPEMFASVAIHQPATTRLAVPRDALISINESSYVFVDAGARDDGRRIFKRRAVKTGDATGALVPVETGLAAGERVVVQSETSHTPSGDEVAPTPAQLEQGHITMATAEVRDVTDDVTVGGRLSFDDTRISHVFSPVNGRITRVLAQPGQRVAKGAALVAIASPDLGGYVADVVKAEADKTQAEHEYQRQKELYEAGVGAKRDLEAAEDAARKAAAEYDRARKLSELLRGGDFDKVSQEYILRSPIAGEVLARHANPGLEVQGQYSNGGSASNVLELFTVGETDELWILGDLYEKDLPRIHEGDAIRLESAAYPGKVFTGRVDWISDVLDPTQHTAKLRCVIDNHDHLLKAEMYERVQIAVPGTKLVVLPRSAVMRLDGETVVFVKDRAPRSDGAVVFKKRKVVARLDDNPETVPIESGLSAGEVVAADHAMMLLGML